MCGTGLIFVGIQDPQFTFFPPSFEMMAGGLFVVPKTDIYSAENTEADNPKPVGC